MTKLIKDLMNGEKAYPAIKNHITRETTSKINKFRNMNEKDFVKLKDWLDQKIKMILTYISAIILSTHFFYKSLGPVKTEIFLLTVIMVTLSFILARMGKGKK